jgi:Flp pilus assembly protein TadG
MSSPGHSPTARESSRAPLLSCERGTTAIEFALIAPVFLSIVLAGLALGLALLARAQLDEATQKGVRAVQVGVATTQAQLKTAICNAIGGLIDCSGLMINLNSYNSLASMNTATPALTYDGSGHVTNNWAANFGPSGSIMVLQVMYQYPVLSGPLFNFASQGNGALLLASTQVFVQE